MSMEKKRDAFPLDRGGEKQGENPGHPEKNGVVTRHLAVGYGKKVLIRDICLTIGRGEIVTLVGPNGSGKSTILNSLARQLKLAGGEVLIEGTDLQKMKAVSLANGAGAHEKALTGENDLQGRGLYGKIPLYGADGTSVSVRQPKGGGGAFSGACT